MLVVAVKRDLIDELVEVEARAGETVMGAALIARRARSTLVPVNRRPLLEQWIARLTRFLSIEPGTIGPAE